MFKGTVKYFTYFFLFITSAIGVFSIISDTYTLWYNWKYENYNIKAIPGYLGNYKYIPKPGYHLEAVCKRAGKQVRLPKIEAFDHIDMIVDGERIPKKYCEILIVKDLTIIPPLSDYKIEPPPKDE